MTPDPSAGTSPLDSVKWGGTETQTDEEWARRKRTAELLAPAVERDRVAMVAALDAQIAVAVASAVGSARLEGAEISEGWQQRVAAAARTPDGIERLIAARIGEVQP